MTSTCRVHECTRESTTVFTFTSQNAPTLEWPVCEQHDLELKTYPFTVTSDAARELLVGKEAPPYIVNFETTRSVGPAVVVNLHLGHDGVTEQQVRLMMTKDDYRELGLFFQ